jgi:asparagine synthase (glutamine-hydrolysing)
MCGIFGFISKNTTKQTLVQATDTLNLRGPDSGGYFFKSPLGLGHRRLSIIDLSTGDQPMFSEDKNLVLVFNGEIYNFLAIKKELQSLSYNFNTSSDTEVILKAYQEWGLKGCLDRLEGMFAFALWDENVKKLFVVRDRFGEKPLYYTLNEEGFYFASELKALESFYDKKKISKEGLNLYFSLTYIPAPYTIYEKVLKLEAGNYIEITAEASFKKVAYYDLKRVVEKNQINSITDYSLAKQQLRQLLFDSVEQRMISDVPLGSFLSGGIDSSIVSAIMAKLSKTPIKTFSIGFKEKAYDESERANLVAKHIGADHTSHILGHEDLLAVVNDTLAYFDEPFGDSSAIPSMMVAKKAREKVTVVLTGDCADELFGGYEKYLGKHYADKYASYPQFIKSVFEGVVNRIPHTNLTNHSLRKIKKVIHSASLSPENRYLALTSLGYAAKQKQSLLTEKYEWNTRELILSHFKELSTTDELTQTFYSDVKLVLEGDMLAKVDRACMLNSLEARVPFLDSKIVDFSFSLPHEFKIEGSNKKKILKETFADLLPEETMKFSKKGFGLPLRLWFQNELKEELTLLLQKEKLIPQGIFDHKYISSILSDHTSNQENHSSKLWLLFVFQKWYFQNNKDE